MIESTDCTTSVLSEDTDVKTIVSPFSFKTFKTADFVVSVLSVESTGSTLTALSFLTH